MKKANERGFSIIELLIVCVIMGIIAALAIPFLQKGIRAAENGNTFATMRTISSSQVSYFQRYGRFGRLTEINNLLSNSLGTPSGATLTRGKFVFSMSETTDAELRDRYTVQAIRNVTGEGQVYRYVLTQTGELQQMEP